MNGEFLISLKMINHTNHALNVPHFKAMDIPRHLLSLITRTPSDPDENASFKSTDANIGLN